MGLNGEDKKNKIVRLIYKKGRVTTQELSSIFKVSTETIRRYLETLEKEAKIKRVHGGAVKITSYSSEDTINERYLKNEKEKVKIAKMAASLINDGDRIIIDEGTTTFQIINYLVGKKDLTILTSSFPLAMEIMNLLSIEQFSGQLVFLGGIVQVDNKRTIGSNALEMLDKYFVDKAFISCEGVSMQYGITAYDSLKAELTKGYLLHAKENIVLADYSKVGIRNYYKIDEIFKVNRIISNKEIPTDWEYKLNRWNVTWTKAE